MNRNDRRTLNRILAELTDLAFELREISEDIEQRADNMADYGFDAKAEQLQDEAETISDGADSIDEVVGEIEGVL